jgi:tetratricopeptide (TPR) repeat protein
MPYPRIVKAGVALVWATLATAPVAFGQTGGLTGKATLQDGSPCVKCPVIIERQEIKGVYKTKTDKKGNYVYVGLQPGNYKITLQDPDGKTLFYITHHVDLGDPTEVNFDLPKEMALQKQEQEKAIQSNPELKRQAEEQAKEQKQFAGLKQLFEQGQALRAQKDYAAAAAKFEEAIPLAKDRNLLAVLTLAADSYNQAKNYPKAVELYQKALAMNPNDATLHNGLGSVYANTGKIAEAQAEFEKSAQLDPANASRAYYNLGAIMYNSGKMDEAAAAFKKATEADPKYADAYFLMGRALMGKLSMTPDGKPLPAPGTVEAFQTYLQLDPNGKYAAEAQQDLQAITGTVPTELKVKKKKAS